MQCKKVVIGSDHGGFELKETLKAELARLGLEVDDVGTHETNSCDYPVFADTVAQSVAGAEPDILGVLICGTGLGMSMSANRRTGVRAAACCNEYMARMARAHNNANVLCLGQRVVGPGTAMSVLEAFLEAEFEGERHQRRIAMFDTAGA
jgi:ribose 5-phosphate isomerase B